MPTPSLNIAINRSGLAVVEDQTAPWYYRLTREYKLTSTVPLIRLLVQQSNCFVVVERGRAFGQMQTERALNQAGELRQGSNFGQGQIVAADYSLNPMITFSQKDTRGVGGALGGIPYAGAFGALAGGLGQAKPRRRSRWSITGRACNWPRPKGPHRIPISPRGMAFSDRAVGEALGDIPTRRKAKYWLEPLQTHTTGLLVP